MKILVSLSIRIIELMKYATTIDEQIKKLKDRGLIISDEEKAKEVLLDIGYYRFGSYLFPFELTYPSKTDRTHKLKNPTFFEDALDLYYFDSDLRLLLLKYITRIEINLRTFITYYVSNVYKENPLWYIDNTVMDEEFADTFDTSIYTEQFKRHPVIADHHKKYPDEVYAPAWKTLEHMTFGAIFQLFLSIKDKEIQSAISRHYNVDKLTIFISYFNAIRYLRNQCAHGDVLFDMKLPTPMKSGPAGKFTSFTNSNIIGAIEVVKYFLRQISIHRHSEFCKRLDLLLDNVENDTIAEVLNDISGFDMNFA